MDQANAHRLTRFITRKNVKTPKLNKPTARNGISERMYSIWRKLASYQLRSCKRRTASSSLTVNAAGKVYKATKFPRRMVGGINVDGLDAGLVGFYRTKSQAGHSYVANQPAMRQEGNRREKCLLISPALQACQRGWWPFNRASGAIPELTNERSDLRTEEKR